MKLDYYMVYLTKLGYEDFDVFNGIENYTVYCNYISSRHEDYIALAIL